MKWANPRAPLSELRPLGISLIFPLAPFRLNPVVLSFLKRTAFRQALIQRFFPLRIKYQIFLFFCPAIPFLKIPLFAKLLINNISNICCFRNVYMLLYQIEQYLSRSMDMDIIIQLVGVIGIIASIISFQCKKHKSILFFRTMNELFFGIQYFLLGAYTGMGMNLVGCVRNVIFTKQLEKGKKTITPVIIFCSLFVISGLIFWQGYKSILIITAKVLSTLAYGNKNTTLVRGVLFITCSCWLIYNCYVFSIAGILCEAFTLCSLIVGIIRLDIIPMLTKKK